MSGGRKILPAMLLAVTAGLALEASAQDTGRYRIIPTSGGDLTALARQLEGVCSCAIELQGGVLAASATPEGAARLLSDARVGWIESASAPPPASPTSAERERIETHGSTQWTMGDYAYDGSGNIISIGGTSGDQFSYDAFGRLAEARVSNGLATPHTQAYTYDRYGNLKTITTDGDTSAELNLAPNPATNRVKMSNVEFNQNGEMTRFLGDTYSYDALGMVKSAVVAAANKIYIYNASDERLATVSLMNGQQGPEQHWEWTLRSPSNRVLRRFSSQVRSSGTQWQWNEDYIYAGDRLLAAEVSSDERTRRFHTDHLGTPRLVTGYGGTKLSQHTYFPFGQQIDAPTNPNAERLQFTGHERDSKTVDYMHARYYATLWGRFLSVDPVFDMKRHLQKPQGWNRYSYVENNPINATDPTGKLIDVLVDAGFIAYDLYDMGRSVVSGEGISKTQGLSLAANVGAAFVPGLTGAGAAVRAAAKADNVVDAANAAPKLLTAGRAVPKHHIFPQRADLAAQFSKRGIDIHKHTLELPKQVHEALHKGGARGGAWNQAWETFFKNNPNATAQQVYKHAGELLHKFGLDQGYKVVPYK